MTGKRAKSAERTSFGTPGTTETLGALHSPPVASGELCRLLPSTPFQSSSGECRTNPATATCNNGAPALRSGAPTQAEWKHNELSIGEQFWRKWLAMEMLAIICRFMWLKIKEHEERLTALEALAS